MLALVVPIYATSYVDCNAERIRNVSVERGLSNFDSNMIGSHALLGRNEAGGSQGHALWRGAAGRDR